MGLYLNVPYAQKDEAKALGAKWDPKVKKWYTDAMPEEYGRFAKWILQETDEAIIATEYVFIVESTQRCWKCGEETRVVGLGIGEFVHVYEDEDGVHCERVEDLIDPGEELHLAWSDAEEEIPPKLLRYLKNHYSVKTGYSKTLGRSCFANHCDCCGALQGNWFLFQEPDSPLCPDVEGEELAARMEKVKIWSIPIDDDLQLNWEVGFGSNDWAYFRYGNYQELILSEDPENDYISYEELYRN